MEAQNHASDHESVSSVPSMDLNLIDFDTIQNSHEITSTNSSNNVGLKSGARVEYGPLHTSQQHIHHQIYPNNSPHAQGDLSLSLDMNSANPHSHHINIATHLPLFIDHNRAARPTLNTRPLLPRYYSPIVPLRLQFPPTTHLPYDQRHHSQLIPRLKKNYESHVNDHQTAKSLDQQVRDQLATPKFDPMIKKRVRDGTPKQYCIIKEPSRPRPSPIYIMGGIENNGRMKKDQSTHILPLIAQKKNPLDFGRVTNSVYDVMFEAVGVPIDPHLRLFVPL